MRIGGKAIKQIVGPIFPADTDVKAKIQIDQVRRRSEVEVACARSAWPESPPDSPRVRLQGDNRVVIRRHGAILAIRRSEENQLVQ